MNRSSNPDPTTTHRKFSDILWIFAVALAGVVIYIIQLEQVRVDTARKQELVLRDSLIQANIAAVVVDSEENILFATPALLELSGYTQTELLDQPLVTLMPAAYRKAHTQGRAAAMGDVSVNQPRRIINCQLQKKNGQNVPITTSLIGTYTAGGMAVITPTNNGVIHEQVQENALEAANVGIWWLDVKKNQMVWGPRMHAMFGHTLQTGWTPDLEGFYRCLHPEDLPWVKKLVLQSFERRSYFKTVFRVIRADKSLVYIQARGQLFEAGDTDIFAGINLLVTEAEYDGGATQELGSQNRPLPSP